MSVVAGGAPEAPSDAVLAERLRAGDNDAFATLYARYAPLVHDFLIRLVRDAAAAEDLTQSTFVQVLEHRDSLRDPARVRSWLYSIAYHLALRQATRARRTVPLDTAEDVAAGEPAPEDAAIAAQAMALVWEAAAGLEPRQYAVLDLTVRRGVSTPEVASVLGVTPGHAAVLVHRTREALGNAVRDLLVSRAARGCPQLDRLVAERPADFTPERRRSVDHHLRHCPQCRQLAERLTNPADLFGLLPLAALPARLESGGAAAALARAGRSVPWLSRRWRTVRTAVRLHPAAVTAGSAVVLVAAGALVAASLHGAPPPVAARPSPAASPTARLVESAASPVPRPTRPAAVASPGPAAPVASKPPVAETPDLYVATGATPGALYPWPAFPRTFPVDNHDVIGALVWTRNSQRASATGTFTVDDCRPSCAGGQTVRFPIRLTASRPVHCTVRVYDRQTGAFHPRPATVYDTLQTRVLAGQPPFVPTFPPACAVTAMPSPAAVPTPTPTRPPAHTAAATPTPRATPLPSPTSAPTASPRPTPTPEPTVVPTPTAEPTATPLPTPTPEPTAVPTATPEPLAYSCGWQGRRVALTHVANVTVESLPDATLIGTCQDFQTTDPTYAALDGEAINVWTAPTEFPGRDVVHNGNQGAQPVYGTWTFPS